MTAFSAGELMTRDVLTVSPTTPLDVLARLLAHRGISAVPVADAEGHVLGIVTEADLLRRLASTGAPEPGWLSRLLGSPEEQAARYVRVHGRVAADVMSAPVIAVEETASAAEVARLLEEKGIRRVPVLRQGRLVGIVSRSDLLRAVLEVPPPLRAEGESEDERILRLLEQERRRQPWAEGAFTYAEVRDGTVRLSGLVRSEEVRKGLRVLAGRIEGVRQVVDEMRVTPSVLLPGV